MAGTRRVRPGECVFSIAEEERVHWKRIWDAPENESLVSLRKEPNILAPGDELFVPERELREEPAATEQRHKFCVHRAVELRIRIHDAKGPRANEPFHLEVDGQIYKGTTPRTGADGLAVIRVSPLLMRAILVVGKLKDEYELLIGFIDPIDTATGQHGRLQNMGYNVGGVQSRWDQDSVKAIRQFLLDQEHQDRAGDVTDPADAKNSKLVKDTYSI